VCWGRNTAGRVGNGTTENAATPVAVRNLSGVSSIAVSGGSSCALKTGGAVSCWGDNSYGQLGDGSNESSSLPVRVKDL
jgi:alpha-tubulin suppressor-like RCC1 family protein